MFRLVYDESSQNLGIGIHQLRGYVFETMFLKGSVTHNSTTRDFALEVQPNYQSMAELAEAKQDVLLRHEFDEARSHDIPIGAYPTLDVVDSVVTNLDQWYRQILKNNGASQRFLIEEGNSYHLIEDKTASNIRYGEAILRARNVQAFAMMRENHPLDFKTVVGKIMPIFLQALGLNEYHLSHDLSKDGNGAVKFVIDKVGAFAFYKPEDENDPAFMERYSYSNGNYHLSFASEAKGDILKKFVFEWLVDAARELKSLTREDFEMHLDELALDVHRSFVQPARNKIEKPVIFDANLRADLPSNVVSLSAFRHS